ncbi:hypothetical protein FRC17_003233, partial [Serendipita sp. 399]
MSFHRLSPKVQEMMQLFAHLDARSIARSMIEKAAERKFLHIPQRADGPLLADTLKQAETLQGIFCPSGEWDAFEFDGMVGECLKYSLLRFSTAQGEKFYSMHPLVQKYLQSTSSTPGNGATRQLVVRLLASAITVGNPHKFFVFNRLLSPHILNVDMNDVIEAGDHYGFGSVLSELGSDLAVGHMRRFLSMWTDLIGADAEPTLQAAFQLANSLKSTGKLAEALPLEEDVLQKWRRKLGPDHLDTITTMSNLSVTYRSLGREPDALPLQEEVLEKRRKILGRHHLDTVAAMSNLAIIYSLVGREADALPLLEEMLQIWRQLEPDHLDTVRAMKGLAGRYSLLAGQPDTERKEMLE